jgi:hypothetical protein
MRTSPVLISVSFVLATSLLLAGCSNRPSRVYPPGIDAEAAGEGAMEKYDTNGDGKVAGEELANAPTLRAALPRLDKNGDQAVSADEVTARVEAWQESRVGRMPGMCRVIYNGRPVANAKVVFDPEEFLGDEIKEATGTTDANGMASVSIAVDPDDESAARGVAPGFYLVRITSDQMNIPAKYNTETTLGCEMAQDANQEMGLTFELK